MLRKRPPFFTAFVIVVAVVTGLVLLSIGRHRLQANDAIACTSAQARVDSRPVVSGMPDQSPVIIRLDFAGAAELVNALGRDSLTDANVDSLLRIQGLCAMVDNVTRFFPGTGVSEFRQDIRAFARTKKPGEDDRYFQLSGVWETRSRVRTLIAAIQANERAVVGEMLSQLERYRPDSGSLAITAYFVAGGVSDGFVFENDPTSLYANLVRANGDLNGVVLNLTHEAYHVMQARAQTRAGIDPSWVSTGPMPSVGRLFAGTLAEGTANYAADPTRSTVAGSNMEIARERYRRNAEPGRIARNFALFDTVLTGLEDGRITWERAYTEGFTNDDDSFYFVGYEMARGLEQYCGRECIGRLFDQAPVEFFRRYIALYKKYPELNGRFSKRTEAFIAAYGTRPTS